MASDSTSLLSVFDAHIDALWVFPVKSCAGISVQQAVLTPTGLAFDRAWMVVDAEGQVSKRAVQLGGKRGDANDKAGPQWIVTGGLKDGEQVVVDGFQKIRPKAPVKPVPWQPAAAAATASAPASSAASAAK